MNLFIDSNIFLSFYHFTSDDLENLKQLGVLIREKEARLLLPEQVIFEVERAREGKLADAIARLEKTRFNIEFPNFCKGYPEYEELMRVKKEAEKAFNNLFIKLLEDIKMHSLKADSVIKELFMLAEKLNTNDGEIYKRARRRLEIGNPPGDKNSLGDRLIWEALLENVPQGEDLYFVSADKHFVSQLNKDEFNVYLLKEWKKVKKSDLIFYRKLSEFFRDHFPGIHLATELEKEILISKFESSSTFRQTHILIAKLRKFTDFSPEQRNAIVEAAVTNNQIYWIIGDQDIKEFLEDIVCGHEDEIESHNLNRLLQLIKSSSQEEDLGYYDDVPF